MEGHSRDHDSGAQMNQWRILNVDGFKEGLQKYRQQQVLEHEREQYQLWLNCFREAAKCGIEVRL
jgi:hypothetical protein